MADTIKTLNLHIRIIARQEIELEKMIDAMNQVFATANIVVNLATTKRLELNREEFDFFNRLDVGDCNLEPSNEQLELSNFRDNAGPTDVVVYICGSVINSHGAIGGCSTHPEGIPMLVISPIAEMYTMAHEIGHLLGLEHCSTDPSILPQRLMNIVAPPEPPPLAKLIASEKRKMRKSDLLQ